MMKLFAAENTTEHRMYRAFMTFLMNHHTAPATASATTTARLGSNSHEAPVMNEFIAGVRDATKSDHTVVSIDRGRRDESARDGDSRDEEKPDDHGGSQKATSNHSEILP